jgi:hypothetical protein
MLHACMEVVSRMLESQLPQQATAGRRVGVAGDMYQSSSSSSSMRRSTAADLQQQSSAGDAQPAAVSSTLPMLVLLGRCCLSLSEELAQSQSVITPPLHAQQHRVARW